MSRRMCSSPHCGESAISQSLAIVISYIAAALALAVPVINSAGADVKTSATITGLDISFMTLILIGVWILAGLIGSAQKHENVVLCVINALGLPGLVLALLAVSQV